MIVDPCGTNVFFEKDAVIVQNEKMKRLIYKLLKLQYCKNSVSLPIGDPSGALSVSRALILLGSFNQRVIRLAMLL